MANQHMYQHHVAVMLLLTTMLLLLAAFLPTPAIAAFNATHLQPVEGSKTFSTVLYGTTPVVAEDHRIATISITLPGNTDVILLDSAMFDLFTTQIQRAIISEQKISAQVVGGVQTIVLSLPADGAASIVPAGEAVQCHIAVTFGSKHDIRSVHATDIPILLEVKYAQTTTTPTAFYITMPTFPTAAPTDMFETADQRTLLHSALITRGDHPDHTDAMSHVILYPALARPNYSSTDISDQKLSEIKIFLSGSWDYIPPSHPNTTHTCRVNSVDCPVTYSGGGNTLSMLSINLTKRSVYVQHNLPLGIACDDTIFRPKRSTTATRMTPPHPTITPTNITTDNIRSSYRGALIVELYDAKGVLADTLPMNSFHNVVDLDTTQLPLLTARFCAKSPTSPFYQGAALSIMCNTTLVRRREVGGDQRSVDWVLSVTSAGTTPDADPLFHTRKASGMNWLQKNGGGNADPDHFLPTKGGGDVLSILIIFAVFVACCVILWQKCFRAIFVQNKSGAGNTLGDELIDSTQSHDDIQL